jgi:hypothetical protein
MNITVYQVGQLNDRDLEQNLLKQNNNFFSPAFRVSYFKIFHVREEIKKLGNE